jgi:sec-independent protein translocase protein TatB
MFGVGPMELGVLAIVAMIVIGPEKLPGFARQAAQMIKTLRELTTGAQKQLRDELGPEFADVDLRYLNPRTAVRKVLFDDEDFDFNSLDPRRRLRDSVLSADDLKAADPREALRESTNGHGTSGSPVRMSKSVSDRPVSYGLGVHTNGAARPRPRPSPRPRASYDEDVT